MIQLFRESKCEDFFGNKILQYYLNNDKNIDIRYKNVDFHLNLL